MLREVLRDFLNFLITADWGCAVVLWAMGFRAAFLRAGECIERRGLFTLRTPLPSEFSKEYYHYYSQMVWLGLAFFVAIGTGFGLLCLKNLFFPSPN
ncbi:hypothetical protein [Afipia sp. GAS231]|uniref:hypothetical protein n=1 Tax=Afipia sp. GAS231 TaxID=1882747 RepID=UPI00087B00EC|nr:hypothetical protein [Afipia sp. GAS231]SDM98147.1 hypothetical protein SAMN05444050_0344 [Afipia sp. GAS231]